MAGNLLGRMFSVITFGESHGPLIGVVVDGLKPGLEIDTDAIQEQMDRRRPGQSKVTTARNEADQVEIVSGVFEGKTTGTPICMLIKNQDQRSKDYSKLKDIFRPGHAAYTFLKKYGIFDHRGGGRASGRETATRVAAGALARQILERRGIELIGFTRKIGELVASQTDYEQIEQNPVRCPDAATAAEMEDLIHEIADSGDSIGGVVELHIKGLPHGLGDPVFGKIDAQLSGALMSIGAIKGIEFGRGFKVAETRGFDNNDLFQEDESGEVVPQTNHAGGVLGGISTGQDIVLRLAVKPPSSINKIQQTVDMAGKPVELSVGGRHDPCICPRVVPVAEAMAALVILDLLLIQEAINPNSDSSPASDELSHLDAQILMLLNQRTRLQTELVENNPGTSEGLDNFCEAGSSIGLDSDGLATVFKAINQLQMQSQ